MEPVPDNVDVLVVGAGPAGLAAGVGVLAEGRSVCVLERGKPAGARGRTLSQDLVAGVGGAGLYSDGKFSFAPSATALWQLKPEATLREAYAWASNVLREEGLQPPPFGLAPSVDVGVASPVKPYPSQYMPLEGRLRLIATLAEQLGSRLVTDADVWLRSAPDGYLGIHQRGQVRGRAAVIASGRFGPLSPVDGVASTFRRVEIGMRVEQDAEGFALDGGQLCELLDPKWINRSPDGRFEWRTFCCCRRGEVITTEFGDLVTVSGRADGPATNQSNFGLNVRFLEPDEARHALARTVGAARNPPLRIRAREFLTDPSASAVAERYGEAVAEALAQGVKAFESDFGVKLADALLHLPAIEGVGYYPDVDEGLAVAPGVWVAGDAAGVFRGLLAALVSGRFAAREASDSL